jgi:hypothetical protein
LALGTVILLTGCDPVSGVYADSEGAASIEFKSGKAFVGTPLGKFECEYVVDGDNITLKNFNGSNLVLTKKKDGSLDGGILFGELKKK